MTELILIRHGETDWNLEGRYTGHSDIPLNECGIQQAKQIAASLRRVHLDAIYSSDLTRAQQTAQILSMETGAPLDIDPRLREINQGEWEGMLFQDIRARYSQAVHERRIRPLDVAAPGGETVRQVRKRVLQAMDMILHEHPQGRIALVSHGLVLALIKVHYCGLPIDQIWDNIPPNTTPERIIVEEG
jgi:alpha-ribazole phosphatase